MWPHNAVPDGQYTDLIAAATRTGGVIDQHALATLLIEQAAADHRRTTAPGPLVEFNDGPATFLFAHAGTSHADRTLLAIGHPESLSLTSAVLWPAVSSLLVIDSQRPRTLTVVRSAVVDLRARDSK